MTARSPSPAGYLRGLAAGCFTGTLAVPAHAAAGGGLPSGATSAQLILLAVVIGALTATIARSDRLPALLGLLTTGQVLGHLLLGTVGHHHGAAPSASLMLAAHVAAVLAGALLVAATGRLGAALSRAVRGIEPPRPGPVADAPAPVFEHADQPWRSALLLAASMSHRGPPVGVVR